MAKHDGIKVSLGGTDLIIPPLNLRALKTLAAKGHLEKLSTLSAGMAMTSDQLEAVIDTVALAIQRNYPDLDAAWVEENVEVGDIQNVLLAVMDASGFKESKGKNAESP